jgi:adenosylcobinamide-GDP ribazoletransferase
VTDFADRLRQLPDDLVAALSFFSRLPVGPPLRPFDLRESAGAWPLAGLLLAVAPAASVVLNSWLAIPPLVSALLALALFIGLTGAMHEDGLADTFDGLAHRRSVFERLAIMRDSHIGVFGALGLILSIGVRAAALGALAVRPSDAVWALLGVAVVSRSLALWHWSVLPPARHDGMAWRAGQPDTAALQVGLLAGLVAAIVLIFVFGWAALLGLLLAGVTVGFFSALTNRRLKGHTGDTIGAMQQIAETMLFAGISANAATIPV